MNFICSEINKAKDETSTFSQQRVSMREEIARLEMASKDLTKKIIESGKLENKLEKKKSKVDACRQNRHYELKIEHARIIDVYQKIRVEMSLIQENMENPIAIDTLKEIRKQEQALRIQNLTQEIEDNEMDLECPMRFELCTTPVFMCPLSHEICNQCRPKMIACPQ